ncbi:hypothetical protein KEM55_008980 [Ascosphaera atra]|nr:hypothetical protein KEM55_008980 [Ascosphaera atra]
MQENLPFRIFYTGSYASLSILCVLVALVTPGDMIYQSYMSRNWKNIFIVIGVYVITALIAVFLYALRMWTNRKLLAEIPKAWIPIDKPDVAKKVHANIAFALARSAVVAQQSKPRDVEAEEEQEQDQGSSENVVIDPAWRIPKTGGPPPWGRVEHPGWTSPACRDLPGGEFAPVIAELPFVLEARAVSLAPPRGRLSPLQKEPAEVNEDVKGKGRAVDAETRASSRHVGEGGTGTGTGTDTPDGKIVQLLLRPKAMCLRDYMNHLVGLKMLKSPDIGRAFTRAYERCRFSGAPVTETDFRALMALFAQLLRAMVTPEPEALAQEVSGSSCQSNSRLSTTPSPSVSPLSPDVSEPDPAGDASTIKGKTPLD